MTRDELISSTENPKVKAVRNLWERKHRASTGLTILEGARLLEDVSRAGARFETVVFTPRFAATPSGGELLQRLERTSAGVVQVSEAVFDRLAGTETPQGVLAVVKSPAAERAAVLAAEKPFILAVDRVQDPGNLGTLIRAAAAAGLTGVLLGQGTVELANPKVLRATMGAAFRLPIAVDVALKGALADLSRMGARLVAGDPTGAVDYFVAPMAPPVSVLVGNEAQGIAPDLLEMVDTRVRIPMSNEVESLNVGVASALLLYECLRQGRGQVFPCH